MCQISLNVLGKLPFVDHAWLHSVEDVGNKLTLPSQPAGLNYCVVKSICEKSFKINELLAGIDYTYNIFVITVSVTNSFLIKFTNSASYSVMSGHVVLDGGRFTLILRLEVYI